MSTPHDALFKYVFSQPEHVAGELRVRAAEPSTLEEWAERVITAESVDDVLL